MTEQIIDKVLVDMETYINTDSLKRLHDSMLKTLSGYDIKPQERSLTIYRGYIPESMKAFLVSFKIEGKSMRTAKLYKCYLEKFFYAVNKKPEDITSDDIRLFLYDYQEQNHVSGSTMDTIRACICSYFRWACADDRIPKDPTTHIAKIKHEKVPRKPLSDMEIEKIRTVCKTARDKALIEFMYSTGCRVSEVINVKVSDLDMKNHELTVLGKGNKHRKVYLNAKAELSIANYLKETGRDFTDCHCLFVNSRRGGFLPLTVSGVERIIQRLGEEAQLDRKLIPHILRHTTATTGLLRGMPVEEVQKMLGHDSINTTMIYAHVTDEQVKQMHSKYIY